MEKAGKEKEKKINSPFRSYLTRNRKLQRNSKKIKKIPLWLQFKPKYDGKGREREKIKIIVPLRSYPSGYRKFQDTNMAAKKFKKPRNTVMASFQAKIGRKRLRKREYKNYHSVT